jgi:hypothetical protein
MRESKHHMVYIKIDECSFMGTTLLRRICPYIEITIEILGKNNKETPPLYSYLLAVKME